MDDQPFSLRCSPRAQIANFLAMEMARAAGARAAAGERIVRFDVGQPSTGAPDAAIAAVREAVALDPLGYTDALGAHRLREAIAEHYTDTHGVAIGAERIAVTTGASGAFTLAFLSLFDTGDRVAMSAPGYPPYRHILAALGMRAAIVEARGNGLQLQASHLDDLSDLAGVLVASPANPTGSMLSKDELSALSRAAGARGIPLVSDEIYHGLVYEREAVSALSVDPDAIVVNSFSKYWAMTGWRVGWIAAPARLIGPIERLAQNLTVSPPHVSQVAALAALQAKDECEARRAVYARNRDMLLEAAPKLGLPPAAPADGAFYMLLDVTAHASDSMEFCWNALAHAGVALTTGVDFDEARGRRWIRLAYARETAEVEDGLYRLGRWLTGG